MSAMDGTLPLTDSLADRAERWMHSPGGRHVMRDLYALAAQYASVWKRTGIPVSIKLLFEIERHRIKCVTARALRCGMVMPTSTDTRSTTPTPHTSPATS